MPTFGSNLFESLAGLGNAMETKRLKDQERDDNEKQQILKLIAPLADRITPESQADFFQGLTGIAQSKNSKDRHQRVGELMIRFANERPDTVKQPVSAPQQFPGERIVDSPFGPGQGAMSPIDQMRERSIQSSPARIETGTNTPLRSAPYAPGTIKLRSAQGDLEREVNQKVGIQTAMIPGAISQYRQQREIEEELNPNTVQIQGVDAQGNAKVATVGKNKGELIGIADLPFKNTSYMTTQMKMDQRAQTDPAMKKVRELSMQLALDNGDSETNWYSYAHSAARQLIELGQINKDFKLAQTEVAQVTADSLRTGGATTPGGNEKLARDRVQDIAQPRAERDKLNAELINVENQLFQLKQPSGAWTRQEEQMRRRDPSRAPSIKLEGRKADIMNQIYSLDRRIKELEGGSAPQSTLPVKPPGSELVAPINKSLIVPSHAPPKGKGPISFAPSVNNPQTGKAYQIGDVIQAGTGKPLKVIDITVDGKVIFDDGTTLK